MVLCVLNLKTLAVKHTLMCIWRRNKRSVKPNSNKQSGWTTIRKRFWSGIERTQWHNVSGNSYELYALLLSVSMDNFHLNVILPSEQHENEISKWQKALVRRRWLEFRVWFRKNKGTKRCSKRIFKENVRLTLQEHLLARATRKCFA